MTLCSRAGMVLAMFTNMATTDIRLYSDGDAAYLHVSRSGRDEHLWHFNAPPITVEDLTSVEACHVTISNGYHAPITVEVTDWERTYRFHSREMWEYRDLGQFLAALGGEAE